MPRKQRPPKRIFQESNFLEIPGEIRMMIYEAALVKATPIDLWPHTYVENPENNPSFAKRIAKAREERPPARINPWEPPVPPYTPKFRQQDDLLHVRKEMATGLLATCRQIRREATSIFWCENTFRFSGDLDWEGIRRFLESIGPSAIRRLPRLEVFVPVSYKNWINEVGHDQSQGDPDWEPFRQAKNVPKMHMSKLGKGTRDLVENLEIVASLLIEAKATPEFSLVLPRGFVLKRMSWDSTIYFPETLIFKPPFMKVSFVIEPGAHAHGDDLREAFTDRGIDLVCIPGSFWFQTENTAMEEAKITELKRFRNGYDCFELLNGIQELMSEDNTRLEVPGKGGRANKSPGPRKVERVLKGFGKSQFPEFSNTCFQLCLNIIHVEQPPPSKIVPLVP
jgi:hypothetical protein